MCHGHGEHTLPMDLLLSESTGLLCLLHLLLPVFCSLFRVPWPAGRCPWESTTVNVCMSAQGGVRCLNPPQISSWSVGSMQNFNIDPSYLREWFFYPPLLLGRPEWLISTGTDKHNNNNNKHQDTPLLENTKMHFHFRVMSRIVFWISL